MRPFFAIIDDARSNTAFDVSITGDAVVNNDFNELSAHDLKEGELQIGLPIAILVLILVFGTLAAASIPLILATCMV